MKKAVIVILVLFAVAFSTYSCVKLYEDEDHHFKIYFENHWVKSVVIVFAIDWNWNDNPYEEFLPLFNEEPIPDNWRDRKILPSGVDSEIMELREYYESLDDQDTIVISVFDAEQPDKKDSECFLVRYHLSKEDLKKVNFHVCYPPTEIMSDFYMKPSFEEVIRHSITMDSSSPIKANSSITP